jgi:cytoskeletal protein CcmA (bactofilin family)
MWKKSESEQPQNEYTPRTAVSQIRERAVIGPSIMVKGDLSGGEDLMILGRVEGKVKLEENNVTVGKEGRVHADIYAKIISVEGEVRGNLYGEEKIVVRKTGRVRGNLSAPRVGLEDGAAPKEPAKETPKITKGTPPIVSDSNPAPSEGKNALGLSVGSTAPKGK